MPTFNIIARVQSDFPSKFGIPRQSGLVEELRATVVFEREYRNPDAVRGLEAYSHIWLLWAFSRAERETWSATVRPPKLGGNTRVGVFATRSPYRPNPIGLSSVRLESVEPETVNGPLLHIAGADLLDGTPIYDIKPYLRYTDSHLDAVGGFAEGEDAPLRVELGAAQSGGLAESEKNALKNLLALDPRPSYQRDERRVYGMEYGNWEVKFTVSGEVLTVVKIEKRENG